MSIAQRFLITLAVVSGCSATGAQAAQVQVYSTIGVQSALEALAPAFERATGHQLQITWGTAAVLVKRLQAGEKADVLVLTEQSLDAMVKEGRAQVGSQVNFASSGMAVVVKQGSAKPDISTPEAYKQTLLQARAIAYSNPAFGGASGVFFAKTLAQMGIASAIEAKAKFPPPSGNAAVLVVSGEADLAIQQEPEVLAVSGVELLGPPPGAYNNITTYTAGLGAGTGVTEAAKSWIAFLLTPEAAAVYTQRGLKPVRR